MSNRLSMSSVQSIETLHQSGHSNREIARLLGLERGAVNKYVRQLKARQAQNLPNAPTGTSLHQPKDFEPNAPTGSESDSAAEATSQTGPADPPIKSGSGPASQCRAYRQTIIDKLDQGLSAKRIHQDLKSDHGFSGSYYSVRRFVSSLLEKTPLPFRRMETLPGEEVQIDFGTGAWVINDNNQKKRRPWMLRLVLSHSRKGYSEVVWRQTTDNFITVIENAFHHFGGVPRRLVIDNLKAAVNQADWYDPEIHPKLQSFAAHYGTVFVPTKAYTPRHKGKVENGVKYAKHNGLQGHQFESLEAQNAHLLDWETNVADTRIHGTTKKQVRQQFELERGSLIALPRDRFAMFHEARRSVSRDGHLEVDKAYYSAPPEYVGRRLWVRWDARMVRVFNDQWKPIAVHSKCEPGRFRTDAAHIPAEKFSAVERGTDALLRQIATIGPHTRAWSEATIQVRGVEGVRVLVGLKALAGKHETAALEQACQTALSYGAHRLRSIRQLLKRAASSTQQQLEFIEEHPIIRPLSDYSLQSLNQFRKERNHEC